MGFWIVAGALSVLVALALLAAFLRPKKGAVPAAAYDLQVYRDQLKEVDRDLDRGVLSEDEAARARTEVSRRVLEADRALQKAEAAEARQGGLGAGLVGAALVAMVAGAFGVYLQIGAPGYPDLPLETRIALVEEAREARPGQDEAEAEVTARPLIEPNPELEELVAQLRTILERRPDDVEGLRLLSRNEAALGNFRAAHLAQERLIAALGDAVTARDHIDHAEMMILAAGGYVSPEAEAALLRGLEAEPRNGTARYYAGLMYAQQGRPDLAYPIWRALLAESTPDAPWLGPIRLQIEEVAMLAGDPVTLAELPQPREVAPRGPTQDQIEAAGEMSAEDRTEMIRGMVGGLAERLATEGGPPQDWARLIGAYVVLGETASARAVYDEALVVFADLPEAIALIEEAGAALPEPAE